MIKEAICEGLDVQEALLKAKAELGLDDTAEYEFEIIQTEEKKKFGLFGGKPAKVRVYIEEVAVEEVSAEKSSDTEKKLFDDKAEVFLRNMLDKMNLTGVVIEKTTGDNAVEFNLSGQDVGFVIGRRGETLDALQYLTSLVANHGEDPYIKVTVNTGNYREKREKTLESLGRKLAFKAIKTGKKTSLEPMNPYERRIIHTSVQKVNGAISWSEGENASRHVVIGPDPKSKNNRRGGYQNNRRGGKRPYNGGGRKPNTTQTAPVDPDRVPLNEGGETGLYGRIN